MKVKDMDKGMDAQKKEALKAAKEVAVKFIETGRISPSNFSDFFPEIYRVVLTAIIDEFPVANTDIKGQAAPKNGSAENVLPLRNVSTRKQHE